MIPALVRAWIADHNPDALLADGFEAAIVGVAERCSQPTLVVYDAQKCIEILVARDGMSYEEASECFGFNTLGAWVGDQTPLYLWRLPADEPPDRTLYEILGKESIMPAESEKQRKFMGAELGRKRAGKKTKTGMSEKQLKDFAKKAPKPK
ncbi:MAG TPA: hypothetical protein VLK88_02775 [Gemmatimonadales bacterium]|nr:hypothetical protein [Gemmatimonadales bacterium]